MHFFKAFCKYFLKSNMFFTVLYYNKFSTNLNNEVHFLNCFNFCVNIFKKIKKVFNLKVLVKWK